MPSYTGLLTNMTVTNDYCCVQVAGTYVVLWSFFVQEDNSDQRFFNSYMLSLSRTAIASARQVNVVTDSGSGVATSLRLV